VGRPNELPPVHDDLSLKVELFDVAVGAPQLVKVENVKMGEMLRLNLGTAATLGNVTSQKDDVIEAKLRRSVCAAVNSRVAISRKIADRWRLIGSAVIS
jgi:translation initiation factor 2 subunit 3